MRTVGRSGKKSARAALSASWLPRDFRIQAGGRPDLLRPEIDSAVTASGGIRTLPARESLFLMLAGMILLALQTTVLTWLDPWGYGPDLCLLLIIYLGMNASVTTGAALATALGFFKDAAGFGIFGVYPGTFLVVFGVVVIVRIRINPRAPKYLVPIVLILALAGAGFTWSSLSFLGWSFRLLPLSWTDPGTTSLFSALTTALFSPFVFWALDQFLLSSGERQERRK